MFQEGFCTNSEVKQTTNPHHIPKSVVHVPVPANAPTKQGGQ